MFKALVVLLLVIILSSLAMALVYLVKDRGHSERTAQALTLRIGLSIVLFILLMLAFRFGLIRPHGLRPPPEGAGNAAQEGIPAR